MDLSIAIDGPAVAVAAKEAGRSALLSFNAKRGQRVVLEISGVTMSPVSASAVIAGIRGPKDDLVSTAPLRCFAASPAGGCKSEIEIGQDGRHVIEVEAPFSAAASYSVSLAMIVQKALAIDAGPIDFAAAHPGDITRFGLDVPAGRSFTLAIDNLVHTPDIESNSLLGVFTPDGKRIAFVGCRTHGFEGRPPNPCKVDVPALAEAIHYEVRISTPYGATVAGRLSATAVAQAK